MKRIWIWKDMMGYPRTSETPVSDRLSVEYVLRDDHEAETERLKKALDQAIEISGICLASDGESVADGAESISFWHSAQELAAYLKELK